MRRICLSIILGSLFLVSSMAAQTMTKDNRLKITRIDRDFAVSELQNANWSLAKEVRIEKYWSGKDAPVGRHAKARLLWSDTSIYLRFEANQDEPLVIRDQPNFTTKSIGLWDRDVCEIFIAPDKTHRNKYFEFEIAPNGEWIDLGIEIRDGKRETDWDYKSGMERAVRYEQGRPAIMAIKIGWKALGRTPKTGDIWLGNLFRCVGKDPGRGYLAWQPTLTETPGFHVPDKFGEFEFVK